MSLMPSPAPDGTSSIWNILLRSKLRKKNPAKAITKCVSWILRLLEQINAKPFNTKQEQESFAKKKVNINDFKGNMIMIIIGLNSAQTKDASSWITSILTTV